MKDKVKTQDRISFVLNGKPVGDKPTLVCPLCGVDRFKQPCPNSNWAGCPVKGTTV